MPRRSGERMAPVIPNPAKIRALRRQAAFERWLKAHCKRQAMREIDAAKADQRWAASYAPSSQMSLPPELVSAIEAVPAALATFETLNKQNWFAPGFRLCGLKTPAGRAKG